MKCIQFTSNYFNKNTREEKINFLNKFLKLKLNNNMIDELLRNRQQILENGIKLEIIQKKGQCIIVDNKYLYVITAQNSSEGRNSFYVQSVITIMNNFILSKYEKVFLYVRNEVIIPESIIDDILISNYIYDDIYLEYHDMKLYEKLTKRYDLTKLSEFKYKTSKKNKSNNGPRFYVDSDKIVLNFKAFGANEKQSELMLSSILKLKEVEQVVFVHMFDGEQKNKVKIMDKYNKYKNRYGSDKVNFIPYDYLNTISEANSNFDNEEVEHIKRVQSKFISNMIELDYDMECIFCDITSSYLLEAAHIYSVKHIKDNSKLTYEQKIKYIHDGYNGAWMCSNHHKMYDKNIITFKNDSLILNDTKICNEFSTNIEKAQNFITEKNFEYFYLEYDSQ